MFFFLIDVSYNCYLIKVNIFITRFRYNDEIKKLQIIDQQLRELNMETDRKLEKVPDLPDELKVKKIII